MVAAMSCVGVFGKVEIDEKAYLVYSLTQTDDPASSGEEARAMDSGGDDLPLQPHRFVSNVSWQSIKIASASHMS